MKISKLKNITKIAVGVLTGYGKPIADGLTGLMTDKLKDKSIDKLKDKSIEILSDNPAIRDIKENITSTIDDTKEILGVNELELRISHIVSPFQKIFRH